MAILIIAFNNLFALEEKGDTLVVSMSDGALNEIIMGDTSDTGARMHKVYELEPDGWYPFSNTLSAITYDLNIVGGKREEGQRRPILLFGADADGWFLIEHGANLTIKGVWIQQIRATAGGGRGPWAKAGINRSGYTKPDTKVILHDIVWDFNDAWAYGGGEFGDISCYVTNCLFRWSGAPANGIWAGQGFQFNNSKLDTLIFQNCTWYGGNAFVVATYGSTHDYMLVDHCTIVDHTQHPFHGYQYNNAEFTNNLFYNAFAIGSNEAYRDGQDPDGLSYAIINADTLTAEDSLDVVDEERVLRVLNNNNYVSPVIVDYWEMAMADTSYHGFLVGDLSYAAGFMNSRTLGMFEDDDRWPYFELENTYNENPGFVNYPDFADTLVQFSKAVFHGEAPTKFNSDPGGGDDTEGDPMIPTPVMVYDLSYTNGTLLTAGTDGEPVGDLTWFEEGGYDNPDLYNWTEPAGPTAIDNNNEFTASEFSLEQNYPNPFNPTTTINYTLAKKAEVELSVYNMLGQKVMTLVNTSKNAGNYSTVLDASQLSSGVYFYQLSNGNSSIMKKMILLK